MYTDNHDWPDTPNILLSIERWFTHVVLSHTNVRRCSTRDFRSNGKTSFARGSGSADHIQLSTSWLTWGLRKIHRETERNPTVPNTSPLRKSCRARTHKYLSIFYEEKSRQPSSSFARRAADITRVCSRGSWIFFAPRRACGIIVSIRTTSLHIVVDFTVTSLARENFP